MDAFEAIAEPNRRRILDILRSGERAAGDIVEALAISQPNASKHLRLLREAGLVSVRPQGQRRLYRIKADHLAPLAEWVEPYRRFWRGKLDALERHLDGDN